MGLDCYVHTTDESDEEIWYGRKENEIHGWMQRKSGVPAEDFNCVKLPLTLELLEEFRQDALDGKLTPTSGFFFGCAGETDYVLNMALKLYVACVLAIKSGKEIYYTSWW